MTVLARDSLCEQIARGYDDMAHVRGRPELSSWVCGGGRGTSSLSDVGVVRTLFFQQLYADMGIPFVMFLDRHKARPGLSRVGTSARSLELRSLHFGNEDGRANSVRMSIPCEIEAIVITASRHVVKSLFIKMQAGNIKIQVEHVHSN